MQVPPVWQFRDRRLVLDRPAVVGILNVTPDSFSDGGHFLAPDAAVGQGARMLADGADMLDIGGQSTRPQGATPVSATEELGRILPVVKRLRDAFPEALLSVDTVQGEVAEVVLDAGVDAINDVSGLRLDPTMAAICAAARCGVILMHSRGGVAEMGTFEHALYGADPVSAVHAELRASVELAERGGVNRSCMVVDPGIGFAKRTEHSLAVLGRLPSLVAWGYPVMVGVSRKRFIGDITGVTTAVERVDGTTGANVAALALGASLFRVHDVRAARQALDVAWAIFQSGRAA